MSTKAYAEQVRVFPQEEPLPLLPVMARASNRAVATVTPYTTVAGQG